jgi:hypothetical protein
MYTLGALAFGLLVVALLLVHYRPADTTEEGFALAAVNPLLVPACVERSTDAQSLLARIASSETSAAAELRLLVSKLCCLEADIATPAAGLIRTLPLQFRTDTDMEPASTTVARCRAGAIPKRDVELMTEKFAKRGAALIREALGGSCSDAQAEFAEVLSRTHRALASACLKPAPTMDRPAGPRDPGFWTPHDVADLSSYQGISASL